MLKMMPLYLETRFLSLFYIMSTIELQQHNRVRRSTSLPSDDDAPRSSAEYDAEDTTLSRPVMALAWENGKLGCAYYSHAFHELFMMEDVQETPRLATATTGLENGDNI